MSHTHCGIRTCWHRSAALILAQSRQAWCCLLLCCDCCIRNQSQALPTDNRMAINCRLWPNLFVVFSCLHRDQWQPSDKQLFNSLSWCFRTLPFWNTKTKTKFYWSQLSFSDRKFSNCLSQVAIDQLGFTQASGWRPLHFFTKHKQHPGAQTVPV